MEQQQPRVRPIGRTKHRLLLDGTCANPTWISPDCCQVSSAKRSYPPVTKFIDHAALREVFSAERSWSGWMMMYVPTVMTSQH
eukprot:scaffold37781_cov300-Skeletonema_dohrnii-CCMP3373.AAC.2